MLRLTIIGERFKIVSSSPPPRNRRYMSMFVGYCTDVDTSCGKVDMPARALEMTGRKRARVSAFGGDASSSHPAPFHRGASTVSSTVHGIPASIAIAGWSRKQAFQTAQLHVATRRRAHRGDTCAKWFRHGPHSSFVSVWNAVLRWPLASSLALFIIQNTLKSVASLRPDILAMAFLPRPFLAC